jgi:hypothetical protein
MAVPVECRMKSWQEQRWLLDFDLVRQRVTKLADMPREHAAAAGRRETITKRFASGMGA